MSTDTNQLQQLHPHGIGPQSPRKREVETPYTIWFPRMCEYGFSDGQDFITFLLESSGRPATNHQLTIALVKELCMLQKTEKGRRFYLNLSKTPELQPYDGQKSPPSQTKMKFRTILSQSLGR